jgi:magnesium chelatase subunit H
MMQKRITGVEAPGLSIAIVTMDDHLAGAVARANRRLQADRPGVSIALHSAASWENDPETLAACHKAIAEADIVIVAMLFVETHIAAVLPQLKARREACDAMIAFMSASEVTRLTRMGRFAMKEGGGGGPLALLKKLRGGEDKSAGAGAKQLKMLKKIPQVLRFIPGTAQDLRAWFLCMQFWLAGSEENVLNLARLVVDRYADGPRKRLRGQTRPAEPIEYPEVGLWHPALAASLPGGIADRLDQLPEKRGAKGVVGLLVMRSYLLAGNTAHYRGVIEAIEAQGFAVRPAFASGLDARPAIERYFTAEGKASVDALVSLTGFSLVGGPAFNDPGAAEAVLTRLDVPYVAGVPLEFETIERWESSERGLSPIEQTIMVAIPELDGATGSIVFGGRRGAAMAAADRDMQPEPERAAMLAARVARLIALRRKPAIERKVAVVLFNFPPNAGATGTAAYLSVFASLHNTLAAMKAEGYVVDLPADAEALRRAVIEGNAAETGAGANVHARIPTDVHVREEPWLDEIEAMWGPAPGRANSDGASIQILGARLGNVFVGIQPAFGFEGDPMRLLFERGFSPTHAFSAFYRFIRRDFAADAVLHFGTHGALEFMPGKQSGLSGACWPDRLIGDMPNLYLYAANNPSEGTLAKRRSAATLVSYLTPPLGKAGLYRGLLDLKASLNRWRGLAPSDGEARADLFETVRSQAGALDLMAGDALVADPDAFVLALGRALHELETTLIPHGLHVVGADPTAAERVDMLAAAAEAHHGAEPARAALEALVAGQPPERAARLADPADGERLVSTFRALDAMNRLLDGRYEIEGLLRGLEGRYLPPAPAGDLIRSPAVLPAGRNMHGFDPFRIPSHSAMADGARQADRLLAKHLSAGFRLPEAIAMVLWGADTLKTEGGPIGHALALMGAAPRFDGYGRLAGARLLPVESLGRPRIDVVITLSGIFRDLLPLQTKLLAEASFLAASAEEPVDRNFIRKHALRYAEANGCDLESASLRVFSNAEGAYGANVNQMIDTGVWGEGSELGEAFARRKCFAYGRDGASSAQPALMRTMMSSVDLAFQNLESIDAGVTTLDQYFDGLGGIARLSGRTGDGELPVYIGDETQGDGKVRTLSEQVQLETRTRMLNPKWYEGMLAHGYEGVRQIESALTNTFGWSATNGAVPEWVYEKVTRTYLLDETMRRRLAEANPRAAMRMANRLLEAHDRKFWSPDPEALDALRRAGEEIEDRLEGIEPAAA